MTGAGGGPEMAHGDAPEPEPAVLDEAVVESLRAHGSQPGLLLSTLAEAFLTEAPTLLREIESAVRSWPPDAAARPAHQLKGAAAYLGARRLAHACDLLERRARESGAVSDDALGLVQAEVALALAAARRHLCPPG